MSGSQPISSSACPAYVLPKSPYPGAATLTTRPDGTAGTLTRAVSSPEVVGGGDQPPLGADRAAAAAFESVEAAVELHLREHGLDHRLAFAVELAAAVAGQQVSHRGVAAAVPVAPRGPLATGVGRDEHLDAAVGDALHLFAVPVAGVGEQHPGRVVDAGRVEFVLGGVEHRLEMTEVAADRFDLGGHDDLVLVGDGLGVVALDPSAQRLDDLGVGIGEIDRALRDLRRRKRLDRAGRHASRSVRGDAARPPGLVGGVGADLRPELLIEAALSLLDALWAVARHRLRVRRAFGLQALLGLAQPAAPTRARGELRRQLVAAAITVELVLGCVGRDRLLDDLARELLVIEVLVAARVGLHLRPVDREHPNLRQPAPGAERKHLAEHARQRLLMALDEPSEDRKSTRLNSSH